jgi:hypothetical protein
VTDRMVLNGLKLIFIILSKSMMSFQRLSYTMLFKSSSVFKIIPIFNESKSEIIVKKDLSCWYPLLSVPLKENHLTLYF